MPLPPVERPMESGVENGEGKVGGRSGGRESGAARCSIDVHKWIRALEKGRAGLKLWKVSVLLNESHLSRSGVALKYSDAWHGAIMNAS